jgi:outer membrane protein assembly factor BamB
VGAAQETWARFRGWNGLGVFAAGQGMAEGLAPTPRWRVALAGSGNGSPALFGDRGWVQSADPATGQQYLQCFSLSEGRLIWQQSFHGQAHKTHAWGSLASSTPTVDDQRVYLCWGSPQQTFLAAVTHDGQVVWQRELGGNRFEHGFGSSPALIDGRLILFHSQDASEEAVTPQHSRMLALAPATGETLWETPLEKTTRVCYGVPVAVPLPEGRTGILAADTGHGLFCLDAITGKMVWETAVIRQRAVAGALAVQGLALASSGSGGGGNQLVAIRLEDQQEVYRISRNANYVPMPVVVDDKLFLPNDKGVLSCCNLADGQVLQQQRVDEQRFNISSSLVAWGKRLLVVSDEGRVRIFSADQDLRPVQELELGEATRATPALGPQGVVFRTETHLQCYDYRG